MLPIVLSLMVSNGTVYVKFEGKLDPPCQSHTANWRRFRLERRVFPSTNWFGVDSLYTIECGPYTMSEPLRFPNAIYQVIEFTNSFTLLPNTNWSVIPPRGNSAW